MINIADQLHAATADGVLANASEIKDGTKMQSTINAEVQAALAQAGRIDDIRQIVRDAAGPCVVADFESEDGIQVGNNLLGYWNDGDWFIDEDHYTDLDELEVGSIVHVTGLPSDEEFHVPASVNEQTLSFDNETRQITGITGQPIPVVVGHSYKVTGIYTFTDWFGGDWTIYTWEDMEKSVTDLVESATAKILAAIAAGGGGGGGGDLEPATDAEYAAFKTHMQTEIANILTPITEEEE